MDQHITSPEDQEAEERRQRLSQSGGKARAAYNASYSRFVRWMRLVLPLTALAIVAIVFTWSKTEEPVKPIRQEDMSEQKSIGKNELLNPRFESTDEKKQPYTVTAQRAVQGEDNEDLVLLEKPMADMLLNSGNWIAAEADRGAYRQDTQRLFLQGHVKLFHDEGYQLETPQLHVDLEENLAWSDTEVYGQGPEGTLEATGLKANNLTGEVVFLGPAKLVLNKPVSGLN